MMLDQAVQFLFDSELAAFLNPQKRIYWGYLLSALVIALGWLILVEKYKIKEAIWQVFSNESWLGQSAKADYLLMLINVLVMALFLPKLIGKIAIATFLFYWLHDVFNGRLLVGVDASPHVISIMFTITLFVVDDFSRYWLHRWLHTVPVLWAFHKVHHSATSLNPFTVFRTHPIEAVLFTLRSALVQGSCVALFIYFFGDKVMLVTVLGAGLFNFVFNILGANLRHSKVSIGFWRPVERIFMSPAQHHVHHSYAPEHIDKNFGVVFSVWDAWFGSHCYSKNNQSLFYGLSKIAGHQEHQLFTLYVQPFKEAGIYLVSSFTSFAGKMKRYLLSNYSH